MIKLTPAENDLLRPWLTDRMCTGPHDFNCKDLAEELDRTAPWVNDGAEGWRRELIVAVIAF